MIPAREDRSPSPYEKLRVSSTVRSAIIAYGIAATTLLLAGSGSADPDQRSPGGGLIYYLLTGLALQALLLIVRRLTARYERRAGLEGHLSPFAVYLFELVADGVTVFLFALATFRGFLQYSNAL